MEMAWHLLPDSLLTWMTRYQQIAVVGVRSPAMTAKIALHLDRFLCFFRQIYGHERISTCLKRDVLAWQALLRAQGLAPATINNHLASLSAFTTWVHSHAPRLFPAGDPAKGIGELALPPLEPRALTGRQIATLKNLCDRLDQFYQRKGRRWIHHAERPPLRLAARPLRDRAIVFVLLSTGLRREELIQLNLSQLSPQTPAGLRHARRARLDQVQGKRKTERAVFLSADARQALADYLERERPQDRTLTDELSQPLFLSAARVANRATDGRLSSRAVNYILEQIGRWHDAELDDPDRHLSPLRPHDLRHTFAFQLARVTGADAYELERRLGHHSQRYIQRYTNPPEEVAASYVEAF
jgi:site-specific recombinase XerD